MPTPTAPSGVFMQSRPLEWIHLPATDKRTLAEDPALIATLIVKGKSRRINSFGENLPKL